MNFKEALLKRGKELGLNDGILRKAIRKIKSSLIPKSNHCVLCYLPPKGIGHTDIFLEHMSDFPPDCPVIYVSDGDWPKAIKIPSPTGKKSDKIACHVFLHGLHEVKQKAFSHFIYIETDCRFARAGWDAEFLKGIGEGIIGAGNLAICNMDKAKPDFKAEFHKLNGKFPFVDKPGGLKHSTILGQRWNCNEPLPFVNGAPSIYSVAELDVLFGSKSIKELVDEMPNQDGAIGEMALKKHGAVGALRKWKHLPSCLATAGESVYPLRHRIDALKNGVVAAHPFKSRWKPAKKDGYTFLHAGDYGDILYAIKTLKIIGGGKLILCHENTCKKYPCRSPITKDGFEMMRPLLERQSYITELEFSEKQKKCDYNFNYFREFWNVPNVNQPSTLVEIHAWYCGVFDLFKPDPWLENIPIKKIAPVIVARSPRYHSPTFPWKELLKKRPMSDYCFVGLPSEHEAFEKEFGRIAYYRPIDFLDLASVIHGAETCCMNQSFPLSLAIGLGKTVMVEEWDKSPDCRVDNGRYFNESKPLDKI